MRVPKSLIISISRVFSERVNSDATVKVGGVITGGDVDVNTLVEFGAWIEVIASELINDLLNIIAKIVMRTILRT